MSTRNSANGMLRCGELAERAGISPDSLRYYERLRLMPPVQRSAAGYRLFPPEALGRLQLIRGALSIGFSVRELAEILRERDSGAAPCHKVRKATAEKLAAIEARVRALQSLRRDLRKQLAVWDKLLANTPRNQPSHLLENLAAHMKNHARAAQFSALTHESKRKVRHR